MGIEENWSSFVAMTKAKADSHSSVAQYWDTVHNVLSLSLIVLSAATTLSTLLPIHIYVPATLGAMTTLVSAITGSLAPSARRQRQMESAKGFRSLMLKMVRVEHERSYEELWGEYNKELITEPFLPSKYKVKADTNFTMSPEFMMIVRQKDCEMKEKMGELEHGFKEHCEALGVDPEELAQEVSGSELEKGVEKGKKDVEVSPAPDSPEEEKEADRPPKPTENHENDENHKDNAEDEDDSDADGSDVNLLTTV